MKVAVLPWLLLIGGIGTPTLAHATEPGPTQSAVEIMRKQRDLHRVRDEEETLAMTLVNKNGETKQREVLRYTITSENDLSKILVRFTAPRDVEGTALLTWEKEDGDDDQWVYLPALRKVKRIASSGKKNRFMGTDFAYEDLRPEHLAANTYRLLGTEVLDGNACWLIEATPSNEKSAADTGYSKRTLWVRQDNYVTVKRAYYDKRGRLEKVQHDSKVSNTQGSVWRSDEVEMRDVQEGTRTVFVSTRRVQEQGLSDDLFTLTELEAGAD